MTTAIQDKLLCTICDAPLRRCPCCGTPFCDAHCSTHELCADCALEINRRVDRVRVLAVSLVALVAVLGAVLAALVDGTLMAGLAAVAVSVPAVVLVAELSGRIARVLLLAVRQRVRAEAEDAVPALSEPGTVSGD